MPLSQAGAVEAALLVWRLAVAPTQMHMRVGGQGRMRRCKQHIHTWEALTGCFYDTCLPKLLRRRTLHAKRNETTSLCLRLGRQAVETGLARMLLTEAEER